MHWLDDLVAAIRRDKRRSRLHFLLLIQYFPTKNLCSVFMHIKGTGGKPGSLGMFLLCDEMYLGYVQVGAETKEI